MAIVTKTVQIPATEVLSTGHSITNPENMFTGLDSETYASIRITYAGTGNSQRTVLGGFDFSVIPDDATIDSFDGYVKCNVEQDIGSTLPSVILGTYSTSQTAVSFTGISEVQTLKAWKSSSLPFSTDLKVVIGGSCESYNTGHINVYGVVIEVTYTAFEPDTHGIFNLILPRG